MMRALTCSLPMSFRCSWNFAQNDILAKSWDDKGNDGDAISITVWNKAGGVWYASNWNGTKTIEQLLGGGNLVVR